jgi:bacterial/archaeal transporter family-2 protein
MIKIFLLVLTAAAGVAAACQSAANATLSERTTLGLSLLTNSVVVLVASALLFLVDGGPRTVATALTVPPRYYIGGVCGFFILTTLALAVPRVGTAMAVALMVLGQGAMGLAIDHYGLWGVEESTVTPLRFLGVVLLVGGVFLLRR